MSQQSNSYFTFFLEEEECRVTSWAEWRYHDNPEFEQMLYMGNEL